MEINREHEIVKASMVSIIGNAVLALLKAIVGIASRSIAITLDAVNSLTDALSSVIAIIGTKLAGKPADHNHPFGYGRIEYLTSIIISALILSAGLSSFIESIRSIREPATPSYSVIALVIVALGAVGKGLIGIYLQRVGKQVSSAALFGTGSDAIMDSMVSAATFVAAILYLTTGIMIESWLAAAISILIIRTGIMLLVETLSKILGERVSPEIAADVERAVSSVEGVRLVSGVMLMDLGPNHVTGSVHVTVDGDMTVAEFDTVARAVQKSAFDATGVALSGVTPYAAPAADKAISQVRGTIGRIVWEHEHVVELRGLYIDPETSTIRFDAIIEYGLDHDELRRSIIDACQERYPDWTFDVRVLPDACD